MTILSKLFIASRLGLFLGVVLTAGCALLSPVTPTPRPTETPMPTMTFVPVPSPTVAATVTLCPDRNYVTLTVTPSTIHVGDTFKLAISTSVGMPAYSVKFSTGEWINAVDRSATHSPNGALFGIISVRLDNYDLGVVLYAQVIGTSTIYAYANGEVWDCREFFWGSAHADPLIITVLPRE